MSSTGQQPVVHSINIMNKIDFKQTKKKFENAHFLAKYEAPLSLFQERINHKERHSVIVGTAYCNRNSRTLFLEHIAKSLGEVLKEKFNTGNFYSLLTDGSTNSAANQK